VDDASRAAGSKVSGPSEKKEEVEEIEVSMQDQDRAARIFSRAGRKQGVEAPAQWSDGQVVEQSGEPMPVYPGALRVADNPDGVAGR